MMSPKWKHTGPVPFFLHRRSVDNEMWRRSAACSSVKYTVPWCMGTSCKTGFPLPFGKSVGSDTHVQRPKGRTVYIQLVVYRERSRLTRVPYEISFNFFGRRQYSVLIGLPALPVGYFPGRERLTST